MGKTYKDKKDLRNKRKEDRPIKLTKPKKDKYKNYDLD